MADVGSASLRIVPKFDGLQAKVKSELAGIDTSSAGKGMGKGLSDGISGGLGGLVKGGAVMGVFAAATGKAMELVSSHVGSAVARFDTLKNYPAVMESLGVSSEEAQASIQTMSDGLSNLPTRLDDMAASTQGIYAASKDMGVSLTKATDAGLALNDMLLAGGQGTQVAGSAMEQFRQILTKGKPDMQDWKSLLSAAPGQMDQLAKSMLGPTAGANDLYEALGGGGAEATITMEQLLDGIIALDREGGDGFASFREQAETAVGGIQTAADNFSNAWTKGIAKVMEAVGRDSLVGPINLAKDAVTGLFDVIAGGAGIVSDGIRYFDDGESASRRLTEAIQGMSGPVEVAAGGFDTLGATVDHAMERAERSQERAREAHKAYLDQLSSSAAAVEEINAKYQSQVSSLEYAGQVIDTYAGKTGLSTAQQQELASAVETVNESCGTQYQVMEDGSGIIDTNTGEVQGNTEAIWDNIRARESMAKAEANMVAKVEADRTHAAAANEYQARRQAAQDSATAVQALVDRYGSLAEVMRKVGETDSLGRPTADALEAQRAWSGFAQSATALREADKAQREAAQSSRELAAEAAALEAKASGAELTVSQLALTTDVAAQAFNAGGSKAKHSIEDFGAALEAASSDDDALRKAMGDPDTMAEIVAAYDGSAASLKGVLEDLGVGFDEAAASAADASGTVSQMGDMLSDISDDAYAALAVTGTGIDGLATALSGAGVSMEQLRTIGVDSLSEMVTTCGGDLATLTGMVLTYNQVPILDKDGSVTVEQTQLADAQGNVYTWNGTALVDKNGNVAVTDKELVDAQGNVVTWNGTSLDVKKSTASVEHQSVKAATGAIRTYNRNAPKNHYARTVIDVIHNTFENIFRTIKGENAAGGIKLNAAGGVALHADGYIATHATWLDGNNIVGEAGAEAIVPLTNRRYSQPFADIIAEGVARKVGGGGVTYNTYIDGATVNGVPAIQDAVVALLVELARRGEMNRG